MRNIHVQSLKNKVVRVDYFIQYIWSPSSKAIDRAQKDKNEWSGWRRVTKMIMCHRKIAVVDEVDET